MIGTMQFPIDPQGPGQSLTYLGHKGDPLSDPSTWGNPNWQKMSFRIFLATTWAVPSFEENAYTHPEKVSTNIRRYFSPYLAGLSSVKSTSQKCPGLFHLNLLPSGTLAWYAFTSWQVLYDSTISLAIRLASPRSCAWGHSLTSSSIFRLI